MNIKIIYEDKSLIVIDKPSGVIVNRSENALGKTVQDWAEEYLKLPVPQEEKACLRRQVSQAPQSSFFDRAGIVHRLDKETSGLLLIAKTKEAFNKLQQQFSDRSVKKKYLTLVHGKLMKEKGTINAPVGRLHWNRRKFGVDPFGRTAETKYRVLEYYSDKKANFYTYLEVEPLSGRTHQIRIHLKYLGNPIVSDNLYTGRKLYRLDCQFAPRLFLHAFFLGFYHPKAQKWLEFKLFLPRELQEVLSSLTKES